MWIKNFILCRKYPFLRVKNLWNGKRYGYKTTELDFLPKGWNKSFGIKICEDIKSVLKKSKEKDFWKKEYRITQIKEKYGSLRWYDFGVPHDVFDDYEKVISKYEEISKVTCYNCGKEAKMRNCGGLYEPLCDKCNKEFIEGRLIK